MGTALKRQSTRNRNPLKLILRGQMIEQQFSEAAAIVIAGAKKEDGLPYYSLGIT